MTETVDTASEQLSWRRFALFAAVLFVNVLWTMSRGWFFADDFQNLFTSREEHFGPHYLGLHLYGHFAPGLRFEFALIEKRLGLNWPAVMVAFAATITAAQVVLFAVVRRLTPYSARLTWIFAVTSVSPLLAPSAIWASAAAQAFPSILFAALVLLAAVMHRQRGRWATVVLYATSLSVGMCFHETFALVAVSAFTLLVLTGAEQPSVPKVTGVLRAQAPLWLSTALIGLVYAYIYLNGDMYGAGPPPPGLSTWLSWSWQLVTNGPLVGLAGGNGAFWPGATGNVLRVLLLATVAGGAIVAWRRGYAVGRAVLYVAVCVIPAMAGSAYGRASVFGAGVGTDFRYAFWLFPATIIGAAIAVEGARPMPAASTGRPRVVLHCAVALVCLLSIATTSRTAAAWPAAKGERWFERVRESVAVEFARTGVPLRVCDDVAPFDLVALREEPYGRLSRVLALDDTLARRLNFVPDPDWCFSPDGEIVRP